MDIIVKIGDCRVMFQVDPVYISEVIPGGFSVPEGFHGKLGSCGPDRAG